MHRLGVWLYHSLPPIDVSKSNFWIAQSLFSILQSLTQPLNLSIWMLVGTISISSFFSFWKLDYFSDMNCYQELFVWHFMFFLNPANHIRFSSAIIRVRYWHRIYSLKINSIPVGEIPVKVFPVCVLYNLRKFRHYNHR